MIPIPDTSRDWKSISIEQALEINKLRELLDNYKHIIKEMQMHQDSLRQELEALKLESKLP